MKRIAHLVFVVALICALAFTALPTPARAETNTVAIDQAVNALMERYRVPGLGMALLKDGEVVYVQGYGYRDAAAKAPVTAETVFGIGSVSKSFTAMGIMQLVDQGKLDLDAPVTTYLPNFALANPEYTPLLTTRHLISHTSGLPRADEQWINSVPATRQAAVAAMKEITPTAKPGEVWQYCNQNHVAAGFILERITGMAWEDYTRKAIFAPLGMNTASFGITTIDHTPNYAIPYNPDVMNDFAPIPLTMEGYEALKPMGPAGSITASATDMAAYARALLGKGTPILSEESRLLMETPVIGLAGRPEGDGVIAVSLSTDIGYGFALLTETYRDYHIVQHGGSVEGYTASMSLVPSEGVAVVLLTNMSSTTAFLETTRLTLLEMLLGLTPTADLAAQVEKRYQLDLATAAAQIAAARAYTPAPDELAFYVGDYDGVTGKFTITLEGKALMLNITQPVTLSLRLYPFAKDEFLVNETPGTTFNFSVGADGVLRIMQSGVEVARRLQSNAPADSTYSDPDGRFSFTVRADLTVVQKDDHALITTPDSAATFTLGTLEMSGDDLGVAVKAVKDRFASAISSDPVDKRDIPINGTTWTQFVYVGADGALFVVEALPKEGTLYYIAIAGSQAGITTYTSALNTMLLSFKLN
ncbi:MAG TPA: serine hydrolase domain-containing protein [Aggregatilineales bacterium]|nr:serine hydrolase [Anaerolineales bacterium]HRE46294.1 serine hydrolase domain-containing protein [Aggregatilineales bacterium]